MSQYDFGTIDAGTKSGAALASDLNAWRDAINSGNKGASAPSYAVAGLSWIDDALDPLWLLKVYDGTNWITVEAINTTANIAYPVTISPKQSFPLAGGTANALTLTPAVPLTAYADLDVLTFEAKFDNTSATTLNVSGIGAKAVRKIVAGADVALVAGDMLLGRRYSLSYDAAANASAGAWILINPSSRQAAAIWSAGTSTEETVVSPAKIAGAIAAQNPFGNALFHARDEKVANTPGGTATSGANVRALNTVKTNETTITLASNQMTIPEGTYWVEASAPMFAAGAHLLVLVDSTNSVVITGTSEFTDATTVAAQTRSVLSGRLIVPVGGITVSLRHYCATGKGVNGLGVQNNRGLPEVYAEIKFWRLK